MFFIALFSFSSSAWAGEADLLANLPPDPGPAGKATLAGIDSDNDGVRDDVQRWIVMTYPNSQKTRAVLTQDAKVMQQFLLDAANPVKTFSNVLQMDKAIDCYFYIDPTNAYSLSHKLKAVVLNTYIRSKAWLQADHQLSGKMTPSSQNKKQGCSFNPDVMPN